MNPMRHYLDLVALSEARRNPDQNPKIYVLDALKKYEDRDDIYVSFTHDVGSETHAVADRGSIAPKPSQNASGAKIGINPQSTYNTPLGIYSYPVDYVIHLMKEGAKVPFGHDRPFIWVLQVTDKVLDTDEYDEGALETDIKKINEYVWRSVATGLPSDYGYNVEKAVETANFDSPAGQFWNVSRLAAMAIAHSKLHRKRYDEWEAREPAFDEDNEDDDGSIERYHFWQSSRPHLSEINKDQINARASREWRALMMHLGYEGVTDREGIIHGSEPIQGVFFSKAAVRVVELVRNTPDRTIQQRTKNNPKAFMFYLRKGQLSNNDIQSFVTNNRNHIDDIVFSKLPEDVQDLVRRTFHVYAPHVKSLTPYGLSDEQTTNVLKYCREAITKAEHLGPMATQWLRDNWKNHYSFAYDDHPEYVIAALRLMAASPSDIANYVIRRAMLDGDDWGWQKLVKNASLLTNAEVAALKENIEGVVDDIPDPDWVRSQLA